MVLRFKQYGLFQSGFGVINKKIIKVLASPNEVKSMCLSFMTQVQFQL